MPTTLPVRSRAASEINPLNEGRNLITDHDLLTVVGFCAYGLLVTVYLMLHFPELGEVIERCNQF
jgi:hypothetical protein